MKKLAIVIGVLVVPGLLALIVVASAGGSYNRLARLAQGVDSQWAQVPNIHQRRADLVPNLVATSAFRPCAGTFAISQKWPLSKGQIRFV